MAGFAHDIAGGNGSLIITQLQSPNFSLTEKTGWAILKNGDAFFFDVTAEGAVSANTVIIKGNGGGLFVYDAGGSLVLSVVGATVPDPLNGQECAGPGISLSAPGFANQIQVRPDKKAILVYG